MPDAGELIALAERCEAAKGPDRELDALIAFAVGAYDNKLRYGLDDCHIVRGERRDDKWLEVRVVGPNGGTLVYDEPYERYTASLDAAMTLPPSWLYPTIICHDREVWLRNSIGNRVAGEDYRAKAATLPLALTAAALRARASQSGDA